LVEVSSPRRRFALSEHSLVVLIGMMIVTGYRIGHDNAGGGGAWFLENVVIDCPSLGKKWHFPHGRWLAKGEDDGHLERELFPQDLATEEYNPCEYFDDFETKLLFVVTKLLSVLLIEKRILKISRARTRHL